MIVALPVRLNLMLIIFCAT